jgi:hypothetical protein
MGGKRVYAGEIDGISIKTVEMNKLEGLPLNEGVVIFRLQQYGISYASR